MANRTLLFASAAALALSLTAAAPAQRDDDKAVLMDIAVASKAQRPILRWELARIWMTQGRASEAAAVLRTIREDTPAFAARPAFMLAEGQALLAAGRADQALMVLVEPELQTAPEACLSRLVARVTLGEGSAAALDWPCASPAIGHRKGDDQRAAIRSVVRALVASGRAAEAAPLAKKLDTRQANDAIVLAELARASGAAAEADKLDRTAMTTGTAPERMAAALSLIDSDLAAGRIDGAEALRRLDRIRFLWRGGALDRRRLARMADIARDLGDRDAELAANAVLLRHFTTPDAAARLARVGEITGHLLDPESNVPLPQAAGLFWDYRDLLPAGPQADATVRQLAERLAAAGLLQRAADLLEYQARHRLSGLARAAVATTAARWRLDSGNPDLALALLRDSETPGIAPDLLAARKRIGAVALIALGRGGEAFALLEGDAGLLGSRLSAELYWQAGDWTRYLAVARPLLPAAGRLSGPQRAEVIRAAIASAMLADEPGIAALRARYAATMRGGDYGAAFLMVTGDPARLTPAALKAAIADADAAIPPSAISEWLRALDATASSPKTAARSGPSPAGKLAAKSARPSAG